MEKFTYTELLAFLTSEKNELEYFGCEKQELISLYEYLDKLKSRNELYQQMISAALESIKTKNRWVKNIVPARYMHSDGLIVYGNSEPNFVLRTDDYDYVRVGGSYSSLFWQSKLKHREKILDNSQEELHEINNIAHELKIEKKKIETASGNFVIDTSTYNKCHVDMGRLTLAKINIPDKKTSGVEMFVHKSIFYTREITLAIMLEQKESENLVRKLYIKE